MTPAHERDKSKLDKSNYGPVSLLLNIPKLFERCMRRQILVDFETIFRIIFRNGYGTQDCLLPMVVNCKKALDQENEHGALLTDLFKAFDCLPHDLIVAKLHAYNGFSIELLKLINSYLILLNQRVKIND